MKLSIIRPAWRRRPGRPARERGARIETFRERTKYRERGARIETVNVDPPLKTGKVAPRASAGRPRCGSALGLFQANWT